MSNQNWPHLRFADWKDSCNTLQLWLQIVGKVKLAHAPWLNHSWQSVLYLSARGLTTMPISHNEKIFSIEFNFLNHSLALETSEGHADRFALFGLSVAAFHERLFAALRRFGLETPIYEMPCELPRVTPLNQDTLHCSYDPVFVQRFWRTLLQAERVMKLFRAKFLGKVSPVQFFWGGMDLAVTRFSGRGAPEHPGGIPHLPDLVTREAYSHEVSSCGFWPGNEHQYPHAAFYSYAYPAPAGFERTAGLPWGAFWHPDLQEFLFPYDAVRDSTDPDRALLAFFQRTYESAAELGRWDRELLEQSPYLTQLQAKYGPKAA